MSLAIFAARLPSQTIKFGSEEEPMELTVFPLDWGIIEPLVQDFWDDISSIFEKISDDRDIVIDRKKEIFFQTAAVRGDGEQDAELRGMHHFSDHKGADL